MSIFKQSRKRDQDTRALKRNEILLAYQSIVASVGFEAASLSKISKAAGIPTSLIFHYFDNKQQMTHALVDLVIEECLNDSIPRVDLNNPDVEAEFEKYIDTLLDIRRNKHNQDPRVFHACSGLGAHDESVALKFESYYKTAYECIYNYFNYFSTKGIISIEEPALAARFALLLVDGLENIWDIWDRLTVSHEAITAQAKRALLDHLHYKK